jgi:hypothetical protein
MRLFNYFFVAVMALASSAAALAQGPTYKRGTTPSEEEIRAWDISIGPAGKELPPGSGTAKEGAKIYAQKCAVCHGPTGAEAQFWGVSGRLRQRYGTLSTAPCPWSKGDPSSRMRFTL